MSFNKILGAVVLSVLLAGCASTQTREVLAKRKRVRQVKEEITIGREMAAPPSQRESDPPG